MRHAINRVIYC